MKQDSDTESATPRPTIPDHGRFSTVFALLTRIRPVDVVRWGLVAMAYGLVGWLLWNTRQALLPFLIGAVLIYLMLPLVNWLSKRMPRWTAILVVYVVALLILIGILAYIIPLLVVQTRQLLTTIPSIPVEDISSRFDELLGLYEKRVPPQVRTVVEDGINNALERLKVNLVSYGQEIGTLVFNSVVQIINTVIFVLGLIVVPIWMFHVMYDYRTIERMVNRVVPKQARNDFWAIARMVDRLLSSYIRGQAMLSLAVGGAVGIGLVIIGALGFKVNYILLLAVIAGLAEFIPVIGPILGAIPAVTVGLFVSPDTVVAVIVVFVVVQALESAFLVPRVIGDSVGIHPAVIMILMIIAGHMFGLIGILLVAPAAAILRDTFLYVYGRLQGMPCPADAVPDFDDIEGSTGLLPDHSPRRSDRLQEQRESVSVLHDRSSCEGQGEQ